MKIMSTVTLAACLAASSPAQPSTIASMTLEPPDNKKDPGYTLYKEGYALVLDEKWEEALEKYAQMIGKFPKSEYVDDARYWSAYSLKHFDLKAAIDAYRNFIKKYPKSTYYDDAVADLNDLQPHGTLWTPSPGTGVTLPEVPRGVTAAIAPQMKIMERQLRRELRHMNGVVHTPMPPMALFGPSREEDLDPGTRLKMDALYALGEKREDEKAYTMLRDVALDMKQPRPLREAAMDALSEFTKYDVVTVFMEIAKKDTNPDIQGYAIDFIGEHGSDKNQRVSALAELYLVLPKSRTDQRQNIIYTIADVGNDKAVDFLKTVALSDVDYDLRRDAVYYLGNIGGEKARSALYDILKGQ